MIRSKGYAVHTAQDKLAPYEFERPSVGEHDVLIEIAYCGVCHSDLHLTRDEWGKSIYPMVPGHEIVGKVVQVGDKVKKFSVGDLAGVGCLVDSCQQCNSCHSHLEQFCEKGAIFTYNSYYYGTDQLTFGGYSNNIVVREEFVLSISPKLDLTRVAPLLCAGITTYSPLRYWQVQSGQRVGVVGLGGLGHMAIKFAHAFGAEVVLFSRTASKKKDALALGADEVVISTDADQMVAQQGRFDFIIDTVSAPHPLDDYLALLKRDGTMVMVGAPDKPLALTVSGLIGPRRKLAGSLIGGLKETQEMLDYCAEKNILSDVELISIDQVNEAYERMLKSDVKYRFVIDLATLE